MSKESLKAIRNLLTTKYTNKEDLEKDLIILKEVIQIDNNKYFTSQKGKVLSIFWKIAMLM